MHTRATHAEVLTLKCAGDLCLPFPDPFFPSMVACYMFLKVLLKDRCNRHSGAAKIQLPLGQPHVDEGLQGATFGEENGNDAVQEVLRSPAIAGSPRSLARCPSPVWEGSRSTEDGTCCFPDMVEDSDEDRTPAWRGYPIGDMSSLDFSGAGSETPTTWRILEEDGAFTCNVDIVIFRGSHGDRCRHSIRGVKPEDIVESILDKIVDFLGSLPDELSLTFQGKTILDMSRTLADLGVTWSSASIGALAWYNSNSVEYWADEQMQPLIMAY